MAVVNTTFEGGLNRNLLMQLHGLVVRSLLYIVQLALILLAILTMLFFLQRLSGDPAAVLAGTSTSPEVLEGIREEMGLNEPLYVQYAVFMQKAIMLDFGESTYFGEPALDVVLERFPRTLKLTAAALTISLGIGIPLGVYAALHHRRIDGIAINLFAGILQAQPAFWLGIVLMLFFAVRLGWFKTASNLEPDPIKQLVLPAVTLAAFHVARFIRLVRSGLIEEMEQPYIVTARAKGLSKRRVWFVHAFRNAMIPVIAFVTLDISLMLGGAFIVENLFSYYGVGDLMINAVFRRDYAVVQATVFVITVLVVLIHSLSNVMYRVLDPRIEI